MHSILVHQCLATDGALISVLCLVFRLRLGDAAYIANDKHLKPWDSLCRRYQHVH
jgi:hypothetical protein